jgi:hypothetical protein
MLSRAKRRLRKQLADERRAFVQTAARRLATFVILERPRGGSPTAPASWLIIPGVLSLRANRLLDHTKLSQRDRGRD